MFAFLHFAFWYFLRPNRGTPYYINEWYWLIDYIYNIGRTPHTFFAPCKMQKCKVGVIRCYSIRYTSLYGWIPLHFAVKCPHYRVFSPHIGALQSTQNRENIPQDTVQRPLFWFLPSHFFHLDTGWNWLSVSENRKKRCRRWILRNFQAIRLQICHFCLCGQPRKTYHKAAISCPFLHFQDLLMALWADFLP